MKQLLTVITMALVCSCGEIGRQAPETQALMLSADGRYIVRNYSVLFVNMYEKKGNSTFRSGFTTHYLEKYDAQTGALVSQSPKIKKNITPIFVSGKLVWLKELNPDSREFDLLAVSLDDFREVLTPEKIKAVNHGLRLVPHQAFRMKSDKSQIVLKGNDARHYKIDEQTGTAQLVDTKETEQAAPDFSGSNWTTPVRRYDFKGSDRRYLVAQTKQGDMRSTDDFIQPEVLGTRESGSFRPLSVDGSWFVLSKTTTDNNGFFQITAVDTTTLETRWSTAMDFSPLPTERKLANAAIAGNGLLAIGKKSMGMLDTRNGKWVWKYN